MTDLFSRLVANAFRETARSDVDDMFWKTHSHEVPVEHSAEPDATSPARTPDPIEPMREQPERVHLQSVAGRQETRSDATSAFPMDPGQIAELPKTAQSGSFAPTLDAAPPNQQADLNPVDRTVEEPPSVVPAVEPTQDVEALVSNEGAPIVHTELRSPLTIWRETSEGVTTTDSRDAEPTVRIHIGRLDVRAVHETQRHARHTKAATNKTPDTNMSLSLDDYLDGTRTAP